ncbi:hypothetical protein G6F56_012962 [Rhizopus delemar]|nr:hypothetical protein G6F56_012962 [Rhizopus delemar]
MNKRKHISDDTDDEPVSKKKSAGFFFVWPKRQFPGPERIYLDSLTAEALKSKLSTVLSLNPSRITEIVWKKRLATSDMLVLMEDALVEEMSNEENLTVDWEIKFDNTIRLVLEFDRK